jgi:hypothetical protein
MRQLKQTKDDSEDEIRCQMDFHWLHLSPEEVEAIDRQEKEKENEYRCVHE